MPVPETSGGDRTIALRRLTGPALRAALPALADLRIRVFRDFPYLYDGTPDYEARYLEAYAAHAGSVIVGAFLGERLVGAATGMPLAEEMDSLKRPFADRGLDPADIFYFGESVLLAEFRGQGIGVRFFHEREAHAREVGFSQAAFCAVIRPKDDPRRPPDYVPLDGFWRRRGYVPVDGLIGTISWRDIGEAEETAKPMQFWLRRL